MFVALPSCLILRFHEGWKRSWILKYSVCLNLLFHCWLNSRHRFLISSSSLSSNGLKAVILSVMFLTSATTVLLELLVRSSNIMAAWSLISRDVLRFCSSYYSTFAIPFRCCLMISSISILSSLLTFSNCFVRMPGGYSISLMQQSSLSTSLLTLSARPLVSDYASLPADYSSWPLCSPNRAQWAHTSLPSLMHRN